MVSSDNLLLHTMCSFDWQLVVGKTQMTLAYIQSNIHFLDLTLGSACYTKLHKDNDYVTFIDQYKP